MRQPAVFFGHGSPMNALGGPYADAWRALGEEIGKPKGVVMVSAHWETRGFGAGMVGDQDQALALLAVRHGDCCVTMIGPDGAGHVLDRQQGDHFPSDLGEAFHSAKNGDVALVVDVDDVAGVMPAAFQRLDALGIVG